MTVKEFEMATEGTVPSISSNDDLARRVKIFLSARHQPSIRHLHIEVNGGTVTLRGQVDSAREKRLSSLCCRHVAGVFQVVDLVDVLAPAAATTSPSAD
jgi:osmotically-inducible protein OsmY